MGICHPSRPTGKTRGAILQGRKWANNAHEPTVKGEPIGWGTIKTHCTAMGSVAVNKPLNSRSDAFDILFFLCLSLYLSHSHSHNLSASLSQPQRPPPPPTHFPSSLLLLLLLLHLALPLPIHPVPCLKGHRVTFPCADLCTRHTLTTHTP